ncbi:hypothetical protein [Arthrobacter sp. IK3]|uniref:hypothetical protein n=1 Tax=Arthrobacter sp. IK3 TaxID=3448169 RepID=UPI003EE34999
MNPISTVTSQAALAELPVHAVVCLPGTPDWGAVKTADDAWTAFGTAGTCSSEFVWKWLNQGTPAAVWVLWDPEAPAPHVPPVVWRTTIPGRRPETKLHKTLGHARGAITHRVGTYPYFAEHDFRIEELDPRTNEFFVRHFIRQGTRMDRLPWK